MKIKEEIKTLCQKLSNIDDLASRCNLQEQIAIKLLYLMERESIAHGAYKGAYNERKIEEAKHIAKSTGSVSKARDEAISEKYGYRNDEVMKEVAWEGIRLFRISVQQVLENARQRTSALKWERSNI